MRHVILVRHGESAINAENRTVKRLCGQFDTQLTDTGREQARNAGRLLAQRVGLNITFAVSSTLGRARETCDIILNQLQQQPSVLPPAIAFNERSLGLFDGRLEEEVFREFPQFAADVSLRRFREDFVQKAPGGENLSDVTARAWSELESLMSRTTGDLLIVSHFNTIKCLLGRALGLSQPEILLLQIGNAVPHILAVNLDGTPNAFSLLGELPLPHEFQVA